MTIYRRLALFIVVYSSSRDSLPVPGFLIARGSLFSRGLLFDTWLGRSLFTLAATIMDGRLPVDVD
jgi:hypothetical protein